MDGRDRERSAARCGFLNLPIPRAVEAAKQTRLGKVYLTGGDGLLVRDLGQEPVGGVPPPDLAPGRTWTTVEFSDLRFAYSFMGSRGNADGRLWRLGLYRGRARRGWGRVGDRQQK